MKQTHYPFPGLGHHRHALRFEHGSHAAVADNVHSLEFCSSCSAVRIADWGMFRSYHDLPSGSHGPHASAMLFSSQARRSTFEAVTRSNPAVPEGSSFTEPSMIPAFPAAMRSELSFEAESTASGEWSRPVISHGTCRHEGISASPRRTLCPGCLAAYRPLSWTEPIRKALGGAHSWKL